MRLEADKLLETARLQVKGSGVSEVQVMQAADDSSVPKQPDPLPSDLMERICDRDNLNLAFKRVRANKGAAGVDGMSADELFLWLSRHKHSLISSLLDGSYQPSPVRRVEIPKPGGGRRQLGIPTVIDRLVQQAILQVVSSVFEPHFSESSYGFRPGRSAHDALRAAQSHVRAGYRYVVDIDIETFFDRVNHDILMSRLSRRIGDKRLLRLIRRFLEGGVMSEGVVTSRGEGTPQGGPLSPLLSNIYLDDLDQEVAKRGHRFCRYADDCNVYVQSRASAERVLTSLGSWLGRKLKLRVNPRKSAASAVSLRKFLGYRVRGDMLLVSPESLQRLKAKLRYWTRRRWPISFSERIKALNDLSRGWVQYYRLASCKHRLAELDEWLRHRLRCVRLHELKRTYPRVRLLIGLGVHDSLAWHSCNPSQGLWRMSGRSGVNFAMSAKWFASEGLISFSSIYTTVKR